MIKRITLENFMSHRRTVIEPADGLTVLTGPNNCGKSAFVLALQTLCTNERGMSKFVRHGQKNARVMVETDDLHRIEWVCENGSVRYIVDGVRTDRSVVPDDMMPKLKLPQVTGDDGKTFDIHFAEQKDPIFLLSGGSRAATFFAASSDAGYLVKMQQVLRARKTEQNGLQRDLKGRVVERDVLLERFTPLPEIEGAIGAAQRTFDELVHGFEVSEGLGQLLTRFDRASDQLMRNQAVADAMEPLSPPPPVGDAESLRRLVFHLEQRSRDVAFSKERTEALTALGAPPVLEDAEGLRQTLATFASRQRQCEVLTARLECVADLLPPEGPTTDLDLKRLIDQIDALSVQVRRSQLDVDAIERERMEVVEEIRRYVSEHPTCPICGSDVSAEAVISGGHVHA